MGFRFHRRIRALPGLALNVGKSGFRSLTAPGARRGAGMWLVVLIALLLLWGVGRLTAAL